MDIFEKTGLFFNFVYLNGNEYFSDWLLMKRLFFILYALLTASAAVLSGKEQFIYTQISRKEGLTSTVNCIYKEKDGDVWLGTPNGLYRFNGYELIHFTDSLTKDRNIYRISKDKNGNFWVLTNDWVLCRKAGEEDFSMMKVEGVSGRYPFHSLCYDDDGIWFGSYGKIFRYHFGKEELSLFCNFEDNPGFICRDICSLDDSTLLCCSHSGSVLIDKISGQTSPSPYHRYSEISAAMIDSKGNVVVSNEKESKRQIISEEVCKDLAEILEGGVIDGVARNAYVAGYHIAAKTGTSEKKDLRDENGELIDGKYICSTVAYAPADDPQYITMIMVDQPTKGTLYGSVVAAPYVANVLETILPYLGVEAVYTDAELEKMAVEAPGVLWWSVEAARGYAESVGFELKVVGSGDLIYAQSPEAGTRVEKEGATLIVYTDRNAEQKTVKVPDLSGKTAVAASQLLANSNLNIKISGAYNYMSGTASTVYAQSIEPGTQVTIGTVVTVYFRDENVADDVENEGLPDTRA